jgi:hypothetical protein
MSERPTEIMTTDAASPNYKGPAILRIAKLGTAPNQYAAILVQIGGFATQWVAGDHLQYQVTHIATSQVSTFEMIIPTGTTTVNVLDPTQTIPPAPVVTDTYTYNLLVNGPATYTVTGPGTYSHEMPWTFTCGPNATDINDLIGNWTASAAPSGFHWIMNPSQ